MSRTFALSWRVQQLFSVSQQKTAILCGQLPNGIFLHMAVKLSRHQCQFFAFSYNIQREISYKSVPHN